MKQFDFQIGRCIFLRLDYGKDLLEQLSEFLEMEGIEAAHISGIGAVRNAEIGYYDQKMREYVKRRVEGGLEILSLSGNVSLKDGKPFPHIHAVLDRDSEIYAGHLFAAEVFACELFIASLDGDIPVRELDELTGLHLWI
ncbi:PPC domain-containing DNA-binding protein [Archaeoglobus sp.]